MAGQSNAPIVQPGAPGSNGKTLTSVAPAAREPFKPDVEFMQGMIMHHAQAVEMTALMAARTKNKALLAFGKRITISQSDEIKMMKQWLEERGQATEMKMDHSKMDHSKMVDGKMPPMLMPGMLSPEQMKALAAASGAKFDHLFLTGMIQHHGGALTMVDDLLRVPGAGQDSLLYDFATDIDNTQTAEIAIMQGMLVKEKK
jgi:uncharacterized protein (DUF305 family)